MKEMVFEVSNLQNSNDRPSCVRIQESNSNAILLVTVERGRSRDTISSVKLRCLHSLISSFLNLELEWPMPVSLFSFDHNILRDENGNAQSFSLLEC